jgi:hypothetical protein
MYCFISMEPIEMQQHRLKIILLHLLLALFDVTIVQLEYFYINWII